jgi:hypothetical protein
MVKIVCAYKELLLVYSELRGTETETETEIGIWQTAFLLLLSAISE